MSQKDISANMNPQNILDAGWRHESAQGTCSGWKEQSVQHFNFSQNNNNRLLFAPTCTICFNENKYLSMSEKSVPTHEKMYASIELESTLFFPQVWCIVDTTVTNPTGFSLRHNILCPNWVHQCPTTPMIHSQRWRFYWRTFSQLNFASIERWCHQQLGHQLQ